MRGHSASAATLRDGTPTSRWSMATTASTMSSRHAEHVVRAAEPERLRCRRARLRAGHLQSRLFEGVRDRHRQAAGGRRRRGISPRTFKIRPASCSHGALVRCSGPRSRTLRPRTAPRWADGTVFFATDDVRLPGPRGRGWRPGLPRHPRCQPDERGPPQLGRLCRTRHGSGRRPDRRRSRDASSIIPTSDRPGTASSPLR